jgi:hypothetical protein
MKQEDFEKLLRSIKHRVGAGKDFMETMGNFVNYGGEIHGFKTYEDTCNFYKRHKNAILELVEEIAQGITENTTDFLRGFQGLQEFSDRQIWQAIENRGDHDIRRVVQNTLAWFAIEEVVKRVIAKEV